LRTVSVSNVEIAAQKRPMAVISELRFRENLQTISRKPYQMYPLHWYGFCFFGSWRI